MQHRYVALILFACTFAPLSPLRAYASPTSSILISEIAWSGSSLSTADEWIELANISAEAVDISSWTLTGIASQETVITIPEHTILEGHRTYLIANYNLGDPKTTLTVQPDFTTTAVSIPNTGCEVTLLDTSGTVVDALASETSHELFTATYPTLERDLLTKDWHGAQESPHIAVFPPYEPNNLEEPLLEEFVNDEIPEAESSIEVLPEADVIDDTESVPPETPLLELPEEPTLLEGVPQAPVEDMSEHISASAQEIIVSLMPVATTTVTSALQEPQAQHNSPEEPLLQENILTEEASSPEPLVHSIDYSVLHVTEFVSDPTETREWIELWNSGDETLPLDGVTVTDASGKATLLTGEIKPRAFLLIENPKGKLNNTGDLIVLTLADHHILFSLAFGTETFSAPKKGTSAGVCADGWHTNLVPSPGDTNICPDNTSEILYETTLSDSPSLDVSRATQGTSSPFQGDAQQAPDISATDHSPFTQVTESVMSEVADKTSTPQEAKVTQQKTVSKNTAVVRDISELETTTSGQRVIVTGILAASPGIFGKRIAYLNGVQIYFHKATWPSLPENTLIRVTGVWDYDGDSRRVKIADVTDIEILGSEMLEPLDWDNVPSNFSGDVLVTASGTLIKKEEDVFLFSSTTGKDFRVLDDAKTGALNMLRAGDLITMTGMLFPLNGTWVIAPRTGDDLHIQPQSTPSQTPPLLTNTTITSSQKNTQTPIVGGGILLSGVSALGYWFIRSKKYLLLFS